jgi:hypothetical protein
MTKDDEIMRLKERICKLEEDNKALKKKLDSARGVPAEDFIAELTHGQRSRYKDGHDITTEGGHRLEVKSSSLHSPSSSKTLRWTWDNLLGLHQTKQYDFLVLVGEKDPRYEEQYPELPYVCFLVPKRDVDTINSDGDCVALNTNLATAKAAKSNVLKRYLVHSREHFLELIADAAAS